MTHPTDVARGRDIVARWCELAEQRLDHLTELFESGRWRRYHSERAFLENIREAKSAVETWRGLLTSEASADNLPVDLSLPQIAAIRQTIDAANDFYVEAPDDFGGTVRHYEIAELVRVAAPVYLKFGLRNAPGIYPSGQHLEPAVLAMSRERVRRAAIGLALLRRYAPDAVPSPLGTRVS